MLSEPAQGSVPGAGLYTPKVVWTCEPKANILFFKCDFLRDYVSQSVLQLSIFFLVFFFSLIYLFIYLITYLLYSFISSLEDRFLVKVPYNFSSLR